MLAICCLCFVAGIASAQTPEYQGDPQGFVRKAVQNEIDEHRTQARYMWKQVSKRPRGEVTKLMVETAECVISRTVAYNGGPLSPKDRAQDDARVNQLLTNPEALRKKKQEQQEDTNRMGRALRSIPDAFLFQFVGLEGANGATLVHYTFEPNPKFDPPNRESMAFPGMKGDMFIDLKAVHIVRINATLFRDVPFGWGILGRLHKGGRFVVEQQQVGPDRWDITHSILSFTGKILLFKSLNLQVEETLTGFRRVPENLSVSQGIDYLKKADGELAQNRNGN